MGRWILSRIMWLALFVSFQASFNCVRNNLPPHLSAPLALQTRIPECFSISIHGWLDCCTTRNPNSVLGFLEVTVGFGGVLLVLEENEIIEAMRLDVSSVIS
ncbi:hypothetical protein EDC04DRAFT_2738635 [Pisolithus marmoratus]|nr:hypothetical protein EDC04DRAFT_2738635 [Pisolithus marmoratus]